MAGELLTAHLARQAAAFLRALRGQQAEEAAAAARRPEREHYATLLHTARRISGTLRAFGPLTEPEWASALCGELDWLASVLAREQRCTATLDRLLEALRRLSGTLPGTTDLPTAGAARAAALLDRRLGLTRSRGRSAALDALGSPRFHALADAVALLASEVPLTAQAYAPAERVLPPLTQQAFRAVAEAAEALPLSTARTAYNGQAFHGALLPEPAPRSEQPSQHPAQHSQHPAQHSGRSAQSAPQAARSPDDAGGAPGTDDPDGPWHTIIALVALARYAMEVYAQPADPAAERLARAWSLLVRHQEALEAAAAAASAAATPRIAPATAYALGVLHADQRREVEAARYLFSRMWQCSDPPSTTAGTGAPVGAAYCRRQ